MKQQGLKRRSSRGALLCAKEMAALLVCILVLPSFSVFGPKSNTTEVTDVLIFGCLH